MKEILSKQNAGVVLAKEENFIEWKEVLIKFKENFGKDVYESWIKNIDLKKIF